MSRSLHCCRLYRERSCSARYGRVVELRWVGEGRGRAAPDRAVPPQRAAVEARFEIDVDGGLAAGCVNLECRQTSCTQGACSVPPCAAGVMTTVSGTVFDPAGKLPLYNCGGLRAERGGRTAHTGGDLRSLRGRRQRPGRVSADGYAGPLRLERRPGRSRGTAGDPGRKVAAADQIPNVAACVENALTDPELTRLPRNQAEGEIPLIAITTGGADSTRVFAAPSRHRRRRNHDRNGHRGEFTCSAAATAGRRYRDPGLRRLAERRRDARGPPSSGAAPRRSPVTTWSCSRAKAAPSSRKAA